MLNTVIFIKDYQLTGEMGLFRQEYCTVIKSSLTFSFISNQFSILYHFLFVGRENVFDLMTLSLYKSTVTVKLCFPDALWKSLA